MQIEPDSPDLYMETEPPTPPREFCDADPNIWIRDDSRKTLLHVQQSVDN